MKSVNDARSLMYEIVQRKDAVDRMSSRLNKGHKVFSDVSQEMPKLTPAELGLLRAVSWFYVLYYEAGDVNVRFLSDRLKVYSLDANGKLSIHLTLVNRLRTYFQHNLNPSKPRDRDIQGHCQVWLKDQCGISEPSQEEEWLNCLIGFLQETFEFFEALSKCMREIEKDESSEQILKDWETRRSRYHPPHEFDKLIFEVARDMGRTLDVARFRKRFYDRWIKELESLHGDYHFEVEARKLIEYALLNETMAVLPITGRDILSTFKNVIPGPQVGEILDTAKVIYEKERCSREQLLDKLRPLIESRVD